MKCRICNEPSGKYVVCYKHRNTKYKYDCKIHGNTWYKGRQCLECEKLKSPIYRIKYNKDRLGNKITKSHYLFPYLERLTNKSKQYQEQFMQRITESSGIYGIFYDNKCLYVGQSSNIKNRIHQHKECFKTAQRHLRGLRLHKQRIHLAKINRKTDFKYYELANKYKLSELTFKKLFNVPKRKNEFEYNELLTYAEQAMIDAYKPKYNTMSARPADRRIKSKGE